MPKDKNLNAQQKQETSAKERASDAQEIAEKVNYLFENFRKPNGSKFTFQEVEDATNGEIHNSWLSKISNGQSSRPGLKVISALTKFFKVDPGFWFNSLDEWLKQREEAEKSGEALYNRIAIRAKKLPPDAQNMIEDIIGAYEKRLNTGKE
jgi:transcriptional regulator with XRE-family HTH domain